MERKKSKLTTIRMKETITQEKGNGSTKIKWIPISLEKVKEIGKQAAEICDLYSMVHLQVKIDLQHDVLEITGHGNEVPKQTPRNSLISGAQWAKVNKRALVGTLRESIKERIAQFQYFFISNVNLDQRALALEKTRTQLRQVLKECPTHILDQLQQVLDKTPSKKKTDLHQKDNSINETTPTRQQQQQQQQQESSEDDTLSETSSIPSELHAQSPSRLQRHELVAPRFRHPGYQQTLFDMEEAMRRPPRKRKYRKKLEAFVHSQDLASTKVLHPLYDWENNKKNEMQNVSLDAFRECEPHQLQPQHYHMHVTKDELQALLSYRQDTQQRRLNDLEEQPARSFLRKGQGSLASAGNPNRKLPKRSLFMLADAPYQEPPSRFKRNTKADRPFKTTFKPKPTFPAVDNNLPAYMHSHASFEPNMVPEENIKRPNTHSNRKAFASPARSTGVSLLEKQYAMGDYAS